MKWVNICKYLILEVYSVALVLTIATPLVQLLRTQGDRPDIDEEMTHSCM